MSRLAMILEGRLWRDVWRASDATFTAWLRVRPAGSPNMTCMMTRGESGMFAAAEDKVTCVPKQVRP